MNQVNQVTAQSREDWLIGRLRNVHGLLESLQMTTTRAAVMRMADAYMALDDTMAYLADRRDEQPEAGIEEIRTEAGADGSGEPPAGEDAPEAEEKNG